MLVCVYAYTDMLLISFNLGIPAEYMYTCGLDMNGSLIL